ncbi:MAG: hypothetical protein ACSLEZ_08335 [Thiobacillus sp.]
MLSSSLIGLVATAILMTASAWGAPAKKPAVKGPSAAPAAEAPAAELTPGQLDAASRVLTGQIPCEFGQSIRITPIDGKPGYFEIVFKRTTYTLVPQETSTGAVRLEDRKAGVVWLQIPAKSMLLNSRIGKRMVDNCLHSEQRFVATPAENSLGIADAPLAPSGLSDPQGPASAAPALSR